MTARRPGESGQRLSAEVLVRVAELAGEQRPPAKPMPRAITDQERDARLSELRRQARDIGATIPGR